MTRRDYGLNDNMRLTKQRKAILDILRATDSHPTADWIYAKAKRQMKNLSLGTVYRNLGILAKVGLIQKLDFGLGQSRYDGNIDNHLHLVCDMCGQVREMMQPKELSEIREIEQKTGFIINRVLMDLHGFCPGCKNLNVEEKA